MPIVVVLEDDLVVVTQRRNRGLLDACLDDKRTANFVALFMVVASFPFFLVMDVWLTRRIGYAKSLLIFEVTYSHAYDGNKLVLVRDGMGGGQIENVPRSFVFSLAQKPMMNEVVIRARTGPSGTK